MAIVAMSMRSVLAIVLTLALLVTLLVLGAIFAFAFRNRRRRFSYFASGADGALGRGESARMAP